MKTDWYIARKGREKIVCSQLRAWIKEKHKEWEVYPSNMRSVTISTSFGRHKEKIIPDFDVIAYSSEKELIGYQVVLFKGTLVDWIEAEGYRGMREGIKIKKEDIKKKAKIRDIILGDQNLCRGIGQAVVSFINGLDKSYLVIPRLTIIRGPQILSTLKVISSQLLIPIGIIGYEPANNSMPISKFEKMKLKFEELAEAKKVNLIWPSKPAEICLYGGAKAVIIKKISSN